MTTTANLPTAAMLEDVPAGGSDRKSSGERLILRQSSGEFGDAPELWRADLARAVPDHDDDEAPDAIGFTEVQARRRALVVARCKAAGYVFHHRSTVALAIHPRHRILELGGVDVLPGQSIGRGSYSDRGIVEATMRSPQGNVWTFHEAHWITGPDPTNQRREARRREQSEAMAERVALHGRARRLAFWAGDTNEDEGQPEHEVQRPMTRAGLVSIYDALGTYPTTHGRTGTLDVVGHYRPDARVRPVSVTVSKPRHSDHRMVTAVYRIRP